MRVFLRGGKFDGKYREIPESDRQFVEDTQVYLITTDRTNEGTPVFKYDNVATEKRKTTGKVEPAHGKFQPTEKIGGKVEPMQKIAGKVEPVQNVKGKVDSPQSKQRG